MIFSLCSFLHDLPPFQFSIRLRWSLWFVVCTSALGQYATLYLMRQAVLFEVKTPHREASEHFRGTLCGVSCSVLGFFSHVLRCSLTCCCAQLALKSLIYQVDCFVPSRRLYPKRQRCVFKSCSQTIKEKGKKKKTVASDFPLWSRLLIKCSTRWFYPLLPSPLTGS